MKIENIEIGKFYRHKNTPKYAYAKVIDIVKPHTFENTTRSTLLKCEWVISKNDKFGLIKYFKASDLIKE